MSTILARLGLALCVRDAVYVEYPTIGALPIMKVIILVQVAPPRPQT